MMRIFLPVFLAVSTTAVTPVPEPSQVERARTIHGIQTANFVQTAVLKDRMETWEESAQRLSDVQDDLEVIVTKVVRMKPDEMEILDPVLLELFEKKEQLVRAVDAGRDGSKKGLITSADEIKTLQDYLELEIQALEDAVSYLGAALEEYTGSNKIEI